eukprot:XP_011670563.1 PREDICTED: bridging integrator 3 homolog [Strongylocentrotus purpuratus]
MSWNFFSRFTGASPKKTVLTREEEKDFETEVNKIEVLDEATKRLYKDMRKCIEAMTSLSKHQCRVAHNLAASPILNTEPDIKSLEGISTSISKVDEFTHELVQYYTECFKIYVEIAASLQHNETVQSDDDFEEELHSKLNDIRALSIVVDD